MRDQGGHFAHVYQTRLLLFFRKKQQQRSLVLTDLEQSLFIETEKIQKKNIKSIVKNDTKILLHYFKIVRENMETYTFSCDCMYE